MRALASRVQRGGVSYRTRLLEAAAKLDDVIALGRGDPDFSHARLTSSRREARDRRQRAPLHPARRAAQAARGDRRSLRQNFALDYSAEEVIVTAGTQEAVMLCMLALVDPGDEVLLPPPALHLLRQRGRVLRRGRGVGADHEENDFALLPAEIASRITPRTKVLVLSRPTTDRCGDAARRDPGDRRARDRARPDRHQRRDLRQDHLRGSEHLSIADAAGMRERTITLNGFSKSTR
jgi:aspartate/methionine/tyrosine aminotransferase